MGTAGNLKAVKPAPQRGLDLCVVGSKSLIEREGGVARIILSSTRGRPIKNTGGPEPQVFANGHKPVVSFLDGIAYALSGCTGSRITQRWPRINVSKWNRGGDAYFERPMRPILFEHGCLRKPFGKTH